METLFDELKRYVVWGAPDEAALRALHPLAASDLERIAGVFYDRILDHDEARRVLESGESTVGQLKVTLQAWMDSLLQGPWDEAYYRRRARIGRVHVRIGLPQHYMLGAMNVLRQEFDALIDGVYPGCEALARAARVAIGKIFDIELAVMLHTYREDLDAQRSRNERLATFGQLVGSIGHELRNPLGVIESSLYILQGRIGEDPRARKHVERISEQVTLSNQIISDLLDMIRDRPLERGPTRLATVVESVVAAVKHPDAVALVVNGFDSLPDLDADASKLRQVLLNLVENAVHAVGEAGEVRIVGELRGAEIIIVVEDTGPGVDPNIRARLFEPLITTKTKGIGLGLPLVKRVVERHGGSVTYVPRTGGGARFTVKLPVGAPHA